MSILENKIRNGNFSSSKIVALTGNGKRKMNDLELMARPKSGVGSKTTYVEVPEILSEAALTYVSERNMERRLGRSLQNENDARPLQWGRIMEMLVHNKLPLEYRLTSDVTLQHPTIPFWVGSPDGDKDNKETVTDLKNPITLKSFCQLVDPFYIGGLTGIEWINAIRNGWQDKDFNEYEAHKEGETYYCQLVSNAIITGAKYAELIIHVPYYSELPTVKEWADDIYWIKNGTDESLTWIPDGGFYKDLNIIRFEVPQSDKDFLIAKVEMAGKLLK